jgi:hypothetical protein
MNDELFLDYIQRAAFDYFILLNNAENGLIPDTSKQGAPASIAAVGFALSSYPIGVERGWITRSEAVRRTLKTLRFFCAGPTDSTFEDMGHKGFCYHFLDMHTGKRTWECEVSFIDTALLLAGILTAASYFDRDNWLEAKIRRLADTFYRRIEWTWALNDGKTLSLAWKPEEGFSPYKWEGYNEGLILYLLGLGSPTFPLCAKDYDTWTSSYPWHNFYGIEYIHASPLFIHQFSHAWIDFRGIQDGYMREHGSDYFENSRRAVLIQQKYAIENKKQFTGYSKDCWGFSACDGPLNISYPAGSAHYDGRGYAARGAPDGLDDGTIAPSSLVASLPFAPEITLSALRHINSTYPDIFKNHRITSSFNPTVLMPDNSVWTAGGYYGIDQGIMILMIENYRSGLIWKLMRKSPYLRAGLQKAGFKGGWLEKEE